MFIQNKTNGNRNENERNGLEKIQPHENSTKGETTNCVYVCLPFIGFEVSFCQISD